LVAGVDPDFHQWLCKGNPHAAAARVNAGDCMIVAGRAKIAPSRSAATPGPLPVLDGAEVVGSGNPETPC